MSADWREAAVYKASAAAGGCACSLSYFSYISPFFFRPLRGRLPIAAQLVFDQVEGGEIGPFRARIFLHHQLHPVFIDLAAHVSFAFAGRWTCHHIGSLHLPADVGR